MAESEYRSYITPISGRPTRESISEAVRFRVPTNFAKFIGQIYDFGKGDPRVCADALYNTFGVYPSGQRAKYGSTPPEFFPVGVTTGDGDHHGFLLHAPELKQDDLPYGHFCPMDYAGVYTVASTSEEAISVQAWNELKTHKKLLKGDPTSEYFREITSICEATIRYCNITPKERDSAKVKVPHGWQHLPSEDGIGTLAPSPWFAPKTLTKFKNWSKLQFMKAAEEETKRGFYATALHYLREGFWNNWRTGPADLAKQMCDLYCLMDRQVVAEALDWTRRNRWEKYSDED